MKTGDPGDTLSLGEHHVEGFPGPGYHLIVSFLVTLDHEDISVAVIIGFEEQTI